MAASTTPDAMHQARQSDRDSAVFSGTPQVIVQTIEDDDLQRRQLKAGLLASPAQIAPKFFYDPQGCALFGAICELDEYYPTRTEQRIFERYRDAIARHLPMHAQWIDLGCGDCAKSRPWLTKVQAQRYVGVDIAHQWLRDSLTRLAGDLPEIDCVGVAADLNAPLDLHDVLAQAPHAPPVFFYPGSSIGNFTAAEALRLLTSIRAHLGKTGDRSDHSGGRLLIGVDLVKDVSLMQAAYDDTLGVTAAFNRNVLRVANRWLDADFDPSAFDHVAVFNPQESRIEMHLRARHAQNVSMGDTQRSFALHETILTECSYKYTHDRFGALLNQAGFGEHHFWTDERQAFGVFVAAA